MPRGFNHADALLKSHSHVGRFLWFRRPMRFVCDESLSEWVWHGSLSLSLSLSLALSFWFKYSCAHARMGSPTIERQFAFHRVPPFRILCCALVDPGILLLEVGDFQDAAGFAHVHLPREEDAVHPPPCYGWDRAVCGDKRTSGSRTLKLLHLRQKGFRITVTPFCLVHDTMCTSVKGSLRPFNDNLSNILRWSSR